MHKNFKVFPVLLGLLLLVAFGAWGKGDEEPPEGAEGVMEMAAPESRFNEAPMLAEMVARGEIPPVDERVPENPYVVEIIDSIGEYGGDIKVFGDQGEWGDLHNIMFWDGLFRIPRDGVGIEPELAESYELSEDQMVVTVHMRKGLKWSDGAPLTSEDIRFMYDDIINYVTPDGTPRTVRNWGSLPQFKATGVVDELTINMITYGGFGTGPLEMCGWQGSRAQCFQASHYLKPYHIKYNPNAQKDAKEDGFETWQDSIKSHYFWGDPQKDLNIPKVSPWLLSEVGTTGAIYERNPYYHAVDPEGNQLPYIDRIIKTVANAEVQQLKVAGGEADISFGALKTENISLYKSSEAAGDFKTLLFPGTMSSAWTLITNNQYGPFGEPHPPERAILSNLKFRQAISVAMNRDEINETLAFGLGTPSAATVFPETTFYQEGWKEYYSQYDPALANKLLDEIGMDKKNADGFRLMPNGDLFTLIIEYTADRCTTFLELAAEYFADVGIKTINKIEDVGLHDQRLQASLVMMWPHTNPNTPPSAERFAFMSLWQWGGMNPKYGAWDRRKGETVAELTGTSTTELPDDWVNYPTPDFDKDWVENQNMELPDDTFKKVILLQNEWRDHAVDMGSPEYMEIGRQIFEIKTKSLNHIGSVGQLPQPLIVKNGLKNHLVPGWQVEALGAQAIQRWAAQMYWDIPERRQ